MNLNAKIPAEVLEIVQQLQQAGFQAYLVGGCVRDVIWGREPKDWDITTDARPQEVQQIFPESVYENLFGTVGVKTESKDPKLKIVEVTTFRIEGKYSDRRHPDEIKFAETLLEDLSRRDFTINALALKIEAGQQVLVDPYEGLKDLRAKLLKAVGDPAQRFQEDALRLMRAVRIAAEFGLEFEQDTEQAVREHVGLLQMIAKERTRDELVKIVMLENAKRGLEWLAGLGLLKYIIPELTEGMGVSQNKHHIYTVWEHNLLALDYTARQNYPLEVRLAALLHDVAKPRTKRGDGPDATFYNHEVVGAKMTFQILNRLHFPNDLVVKVTHLVRSHLFYYNVGEVTEAGVRRFLKRVGLENLEDLIRVREADRIGSGVPKAKPYRIRHLLFMIDKVRQDPLSTSMLAFDGNQVMKILNIPPGPRVGWILNVLLEEVLEQPEKNTEEYLKIRMLELHGLTDDKLQALTEKAKQAKQEFEQEQEQAIKEKYFVK